MIFGYFKDETTSKEKRGTQEIATEILDSLRQLLSTYDRMSKAEKLFLRINNRPVDRVKYLHYMVGKRITTRLSLLFLGFNTAVYEGIGGFKSTNPLKVPIEKLEEAQEIADAEEVQIVSKELEDEDSVNIVKAFKENFWEIMTNRIHIKRFYKALEKNDGKIPKELNPKPESKELTNANGEFFFKYKFTPEQQQRLKHSNQQEFITDCIDGLLYSWQQERRVPHPEDPSWNPNIMVPLPMKREPMTTFRVGDTYVKGTWSAEGTFAGVARALNYDAQTNQVSEKQYDDAFSKAFNPIKREENLKELDSPEATDLIVDFKRVNTVNGVPQLPSQDEIVNDEKLLTALGAWGAIQFYLDEEGAIVGMAVKYNHQFIDGAQGGTESKQAIKTALRNVREKDSAESGFVTALSQNQLDLIDVYQKQEKKYRPRNRIFETKIPYEKIQQPSTRLYDYQKKVRLLKNTDQISAAEYDHITASLSAEEKKILENFMTADLGVAALTHLLNLMALGWRSGQFLEMKPSSGNVSVTFMLNALVANPNVPHHLFLETMSLFSDCRTNIRGEKGKPETENEGEIDAFGAYRRLLMNSTVFLGRGTDPVKTDIMAHNMFSSMNLRNTAPTYDEDDPVEDGFATALEENYKLTIGNSYGEGDDGTGNIIFSLRCRARSARRYKKFAQNVEQKLPVLEDYLSGLEKRIIAIIDKLDLSAVAA